MYKYQTLNNIAPEGLEVLSNQKYAEVSENPDGLLLRSHKLLESDLGENLVCVARAGAGTNNIPIDDATKRGIVVFNTPGANANAVKELVICGMLLSSRGIIEGIDFSKTENVKTSQETKSSQQEIVTT